MNWVKSPAIITRELASSASAWTGPFAPVPVTKPESTDPAAASSSVIVKVATVGLPRNAPFVAVSVSVNVRGPSTTRFGTTVTRILVLVCPSAKCSVLVTPT